MFHAAARNFASSNCPLTMRLLLNNRRCFSFSYPAPRTLGEITNLPLLELEESSAVKKIWESHHNNQETAVATTLLEEEFSTVLLRAESSPFFIFPVKRESGHFILLSQAQGKHFLYTFLEDYKTNPDTATPYLSLTFYDDFLVNKGLGLVRGDFSEMITKPEAQTLLQVTTNLYLNQYEEIDRFNNRPGEFNFERYIEKSLEGK
jgi:ATP synthase F1 complex assembly factor 1